MEIDQLGQPLLREAMRLAGRLDVFTQARQHHRIALLPPRRHQAKRDEIPV
ncbi:MAG: hypothetical protein ACKPB0_03495 [Opitutaceae bacterium]